MAKNEEGGLKTEGIVMNRLSILNNLILADFAIKICQCVTWALLDRNHHSPAMHCFF